MEYNWGKTWENTYVKIGRYIALIYPDVMVMDSYKPKLGFFQFAASITDKLRNMFRIG